MEHKVYTGGSFDLFHAGHVRFLGMCAALGKVVVALNTDEFIERYKGKKQIIPYEQRRDILLACRYVYDVVENTCGEDSKPTILQVRPSIIAIGSDWAKKDYCGQMEFTPGWLDENGIMLVYLPYTDGVSSTRIKEKLNGECDRSYNNP